MDSEPAVISSDHRERLLPILIRLALLRSGLEGSWNLSCHLILRTLEYRIFKGTQMMYSGPVYCKAALDLVGTNLALPDLSPRPYPIVTSPRRLLYGRMQRQGGHNTTKAGGAGRRSLVLRFLGGCEGTELTEFIQLLTLPFHGILKEKGEI